EFDSIGQCDDFREATVSRVSRPEPCRSQFAARRTGSRAAGCKSSANYSASGGIVGDLCAGQRFAADCSTGARPFGSAAAAEIFERRIESFGVELATSF